MTLRRVSEKQKEKNRVKAQETGELHQLMREIWDEREDEAGFCYCFETGQPLDGVKYRSNTCCYDHVLEKSVYPQYKMVKRNIVILHPDVHTLKTGDVEKTPKVKAYRDKLLELHNQNNLD